MRTLLTIVLTLGVWLGIKHLGSWFLWWWWQQGH